LASLDAFRGFTIAGMILVNTPGSWDHVYPQLRHAAWHGWTLTDLVFPFFLFIVGVAMTFSFGHRLEGGNRRRLHRKVPQRAIVIFALGLLLAAFPDFDLANLRVVGVLQRIALVYLVSSWIVLVTSRRAQGWIVVALLGGYWAAMTWIPVPGVGAGVLTPEGNFAAWIDRFIVPGQMYRGSWDPEGLFSTLPAIATTLLGVFTGYWIRSGRDRAKIAAGLFIGGSVTLLAGLAWGVWLPINKNLWTSSYVLFTAGAALVVLAFCYWLIDVLGYRRWARPAIVYGLNPLAVYVLSSLVAKLLARLGFTHWAYETVLTPWLAPLNASLVFALSWVVLWWSVAALLYRQRIFIKI
jgi:predicted acyltransferase